MSNVKFEKPPLAELILGIQFEEGVFSPNDIFDIYERLKDEFPLIEEHPALPAVIESESKPTTFHFPNDNSARKFFISATGEHLLQFQSNRLFFNWRKSANGVENEYKNFDSVFEYFIGILTALNEEYDFLKKVNQYEITFFDHLILDELKLKLSESLLALNIITFDEALKTMQVGLQFFKSELPATLYVNIRSGKMTSDSKDVIILESTCRGFSGKSLDEIERWLRQAHEELVEIFVHILSDHSKKTYGISAK